MDPMWQTVFTVALMAAAYFWGARIGFYRGLDELTQVYLIGFDMHEVKLDGDMKTLVFVDADGKEWRSTNAFSKK